MDVWTDSVIVVSGVVVVASSEEVVGRDGAAEVELSHRESRGSGGSNRMLLPSTSSANRSYGHQIRVVQGQTLNQTKAIIKVRFFCSVSGKTITKIYTLEDIFLIFEKKFQFEFKENFRNTHKKCIINSSNEKTNI